MSESPGELAHEATLLERGVRLLHLERDPDGAIAAMSEYNDRYPKGALTEEARVILIEALLERGRTAEALVVLHDIQPQNAARGRDLTALRGELLGRAGRCSEALADFVMVLRVEVGDPAEERAIVGRATCRASAGDFAGTDDDLASYLVRFPNGRFAGSVRRTLHR